MNTPLRSLYSCRLADLHQKWRLTCCSSSVKERKLRDNSWRTDWWCRQLSKWKSIGKHFDKQQQSHWIHWRHFKKKHPSSPWVTGRFVAASMSRTVRQPACSRRSARGFSWPGAECSGRRNTGSGCGCCGDDSAAVEWTDSSRLRTYNSSRLPWNISASGGLVVWKDIRAMTALDHCGWS